MFTGSLMTYYYNTIHNAHKSAKRNRYVIKNISVNTKEEFQSEIIDALDQIPPGKGYVLVKWNNTLSICEKDPHNPSVNYIKHTVKYHPLASHFPN